VTGGMRTLLMKTAIELLYRSPFRRYALPRYTFGFTPQQLAFLCQCVERTRAVPGTVLEVGCARGYTTLFLNRFMDSAGIEKPYVCLDTFRGFLERDVAYEADRRGKNRADYRAYRVNSLRWFRGTMRASGIGRVRAIRGDAAEFDFATLGPIAFCLLDVDLYLPVHAALGRILDNLAPGGIVVVDDCDPGMAMFDGAEQAYREVAAGLPWPARIVLGKLGVLEKPVAVPA